MELGSTTSEAGRLSGILLPCMHHIEHFILGHCVAVHQDVVGVGDQLMGACHSTAPILSRKQAQGIGVFHQRSTSRRAAVGSRCAMNSVMTSRSSNAVSSQTTLRMLGSGGMNQSVHASHNFIAGMALDGRIVCPTQGGTNFGLKPKLVLVRIFLGCEFRDQGIKWHVHRERVAQTRGPGAQRPEPGVCPPLPKKSACRWAGSAS